MQVPISQSDNCNNNGFTLIEVMVALVILMVGMMGLLSATSTALELNVKNQFRDEALQLADERLRIAKGNGAATFVVPFAGISTSVVRNSRLRSKNLAFTVTLGATAAGDSSNVLSSIATWNYKGQSNNQEITSLKQYH